MSITLATITTVNHEITEFSLNKTIKNSPFVYDNVLIYSDRPIAVDTPSSKISRIEIPSKFGLLEYSEFCIKVLYNDVKTDHVLITQYDGMAVNADMWSEEFLEYDYIGSPTFTHSPWLQIKNIKKLQNIPYKWYNGGGGFSLRSKKLLKALQDDRIPYWYEAILTGQEDKGYQKVTSEDISICLIYKEFLEKEHGIKFAPIETCLRFSSETLHSRFPISFGFHGWDNLPQYMTEDECIYYYSRLVNRSFKPGALLISLYSKLVFLRYFRALDFLQNMFPELPKILNK